jgi:LuxR family transcriptional regulator, maltose regulon positive regulatory protein
MPTITSHAKVSPPRVPGVLHRPRLLDLLKKNQDKRLLFILGQAAQGKTTLAASYAKTQDIPVAWLNLDQGDSDPVNLFYWMINAFEFTLPERDLSFLRSYPAMSRAAREPALLYQEWVRVMFDQINDPVQLVLDGLDRLSNNAPSLLFLQTLVYQCPPHIRLILLSREEPPFGLQELKIKQQAQILTNEDLAFRLEETKAFFRETRKVSLNSSQVARVHSSTEGWVGGLLLFSEALERLAEGERESYIAEKLPDQIRKEAFRFFEEVILSSQPPEVREFLIKSSILDKVETDLIGELLETKAMEEVLREAARKHLFVQTIYEEGKGWVYRYHQLFRDFLQLRFNTELSPETRKSLSFKAGLLFQKRNRQEEAIRFFLKAGAYESAVPAIEKIGLDLILSLKTAELLEWLQAFPEEIRQNNPWLLYYLSRARHFTNPAENLPIYHQVLTLFEKARDLRGCLLSLGSLIVASIWCSHELVPLDELLAKGENLLGQIKNSLFPRERSMLWTCIGVGLLHINPRKAFQANQNGYLLACEIKEVVLQLNPLANCMVALLMLDEHPLADEMSKKIEAILSKYPYPEVSFQYRSYRGIIFLVKGELENAEAEFEIARKECEQVGRSYLYPAIMQEYIILKANLGQYREAEELGQRVLQLATAQGQLLRVGFALLNLGTKYNFEGAYDQAKEYARQCFEILPSIGASSIFLKHKLSFLRGSLWRPGEEEETVLNDLQNALDYYLSIWNGHAIDTHFALALIYWRKNDKNKTVQHLHSGFNIARQKGLYYIAWSSPKDIAKVCALAIELGNQEDADCTLKILNTRRPPQAREELERLMNHPDPTVRSRAARIGLALHQSTLPRLRIETLGGFRVIRSCSPVKEEEWHGSQAKNLLKAIVAWGGEGVQKEVLMESLWAEGQPAKVEKTFKSALHRLRQVLEPELDSRYGYSYVGMKDNRVSLDKEICEVDVNKFLELIKEGEEREASSQVEEALSFYQKAAELYRGDFLANDGYTEWSESRREELRRKYLGLLLKTARIHEDRGAARKTISYYEKAIQFDPFSEEANRRLMVLYAGMGKQDEALNIYKTYQKALREGLDAEPDALTKSLYNKIQKP